MYMGIYTCAVYCMYMYIHCTCTYMSIIMYKYMYMYMYVHTCMYFVVHCIRVSEDVSCAITFYVRLAWNPRM